jgi:hypothetical protein
MTEKKTHHAPSDVSSEIASVHASVAHIGYENARENAGPTGGRYGKFTFGFTEWGVGGEAGASRKLGQIAAKESLPPITFWIALRAQVECLSPFSGETRVESETF